MISILPARRPVIPSSVSTLSKTTPLRRLPETQEIPGPGASSAGPGTVFLSCDYYENFAPAAAGQGSDVPENHTTRSRAGYGAAFKPKPEGTDERMPFVGSASGRGDCD